ncbi:MAG: chloride channel protein [Clostridia bacterium]|nr:chloride channel protein [Clostridia bacterium]
MKEIIQKKIRTHFTSSTLPALIFGAIGGILTGCAVTLYKFFAKGAVALSEGIFLFLKLTPWFLLPMIVLLFGVATFLTRIYRKESDLQGGGIPSSIGTQRGLFSFHWIKSAVGSFFLSLLSFLFGVPLGTEGPSVLLGTALGAGTVSLANEKYKPWKRFSMTGGASAGFAVATGAPISGIFFAVEESHQRISPLIVLTATVSVLTAEITAALISPLFGVDFSLFSLQNIPALPLSSLWIALVLGILLGLFSVAFLKFYTLLNALIKTKLGKVKQNIKIFLVLVLTLIFGLFSENFISTGHHLLNEFFTVSFPFFTLIFIILIRSLLTLSANISGITGGIFLPLLAIGGAVGSLAFSLFASLGGKEELLSFFICLGICGCIAGMMKMPLTAILFGVEALGLSSNLLFLILVCALSYTIPESLGEDSISERVLETKKEALHLKTSLIEKEIEIQISPDAFAVGKEIRDILWPDGTFVLSVKKTGPDSHLLSAGDLLSVCLKTYDEERTMEELNSICLQCKGE